MPKSETGLPGAPGQRLDKWLWFARIAKTRTLATRIVEGGKARVNRARVGKASRTIRPGDVITLAIHDQVRILKVVACGERRGPASEARLLYEDMSPPPVPRVFRPRTPPPAARAKGSGRPTKRERRQMDAWLSSDDRVDGESDRNR